MMSGQTPPDMLHSSSSGELPYEAGDTPEGRRGDKRALIIAIRQCAIILICAIDDYLGWDRTVRTRRRRD